MPPPALFVFLKLPMATLLDGKTVSSLILKRVRREARRLRGKGIQPKLAFLLVGKNPASLAYVSQKEKACKKVGIEYTRKNLPANISAKKLINIIQHFNRDRRIHGVLVQLPLPPHIDAQKILALLDPRKDVDGFHPENLGSLAIGTGRGFFPCTPKGVIELLDYYKIPIEGKHAVIVGRSNIVGKPLAIMLLNRGATITVCHRKTRNLSKYTKEADILCVAAGRPGLIKGNMVKRGCVVIDVGFTRLSSGKISGDVIFDSVEKKASYITPVPGGVGPMTVACLMENVVKAARAFASRGRSV